jgi:hypothetical protein
MPNWRLCYSFLDQTAEQGGHFLDADDVINFDLPQGAQRHGRERGLFRILHDGDPAPPFDLPEASSTIVEFAAQKNSDFEAIRTYSSPSFCGPETGR